MLLTAFSCTSKVKNNSVYSTEMIESVCDCMNESDLTFESDYEIQNEILESCNPIDSSAFLPLNLQAQLVGECETILIYSEKVMDLQIVESARRLTLNEINSIDSVYLKCVDQYSENNFEGVLKQIGELEENELNKSFYLLRTLAYVRLGKYPQAVKELNNLEQDEWAVYFRAYIEAKEKSM